MVDKPPVTPDESHLEALLQQSTSYDDKLLEAHAQTAGLANTATGQRVSNELSMAAKFARERSQPREPATVPPPREEVAGNNPDRQPAEGSHGLGGMARFRPSGGSSGGHGRF